MLIRIVRLTFRPEALGAFMPLFDDAAPRIRAFEGCLHLELWQDERYANILTTYSQWTDSEALDRYRQSDLFRATWDLARSLFAAPPEAHSYRLLRSHREAAPELNE